MSWTWAKGGDNFNFLGVLRTPWRELIAFSDTRIVLCRVCEKRVVRVGRGPETILCQSCSRELADESAT